MDYWTGLERVSEMSVFSYFLDGIYSSGLILMTLILIKLIFDYLGAKEHEYENKGLVTCQVIGLQNSLLCPLFAITE